MANIQAAPVQAYLGAMMPGSAGHLTTLPAGTALMPRPVIPRHLQAQAFDKMGTALLVGEGLAPMAVSGLSKYGGAAGAVAAGAISIASGSHIQKRQIAKLVDDYGSLVSAELGIAPEQVDEKALRAAAGKNEYLKQALTAIDHAKHVRPRDNIVTTGAMAGAGLAVSALVPAFWPGLIVGGIAATAASWGASKGLEVIDHHTTFDQTAIGRISSLSAKRAAGGMVSTAEVFGVFVNGKPELHAAIREETGAEFPAKDPARMTPEEQAKLQELIDKHPKLRDLAATYANWINIDKITPESLVALDLDVAMGIKPVALGSPAMAATLPETAAITEPGFAQREQQRRATSQAAAGRA